MAGPGLHARQYWLGQLMDKYQPLKMVKNKLPQVLKAIHELAGQDVLVGYPSGEKNERREGGMTNAALGYIHENGAPEVGIPARPHLLPGVRAAKEPITENFKQAGKAALQGDASKVTRAMHAAGLVAQSSVRDKISSGPFEPLKQATIRRRMTRGKAARKGITVDPATGLLTGAKPLIDTAQMQRAVTYIVRSGK